MIMAATARSTRPRSPPSRRTWWKARRGCSIAATSGSSTPAWTLPVGSWMTAGATGCRPCGRPSNRNTSRPPGCSSRRGRGGRCCRLRFQSTTAASARGGAPRWDVSLGQGRPREGELRARSGVRAARASIEAEARALDAPRSLGARRRGAAHHRRGVSCRRHHQHRARRRAAPLRDAETAVRQAEDRARFGRLALLVALGQFPA